MFFSSLLGIRMRIAKQTGMCALTVLCLFSLNACDVSSSTTGRNSTRLPGNGVKTEGNDVGQIAFEINGKTAADGSPIQLSKFKGKVVLLDFWAPWCKACVDAIPHERQLVARHAAKPFALIGISVDGVGKHQLPWPNIVDEDASINQKWNIEVLPTFILIDPHGEIVGRWEGSQDLPIIANAIEREIELIQTK
jgi:thiol-disulfide isomerase/thioredoxin